MNSPLSADDIEFTPYQLYKTAEKSVRVYSEWLTGNAAWEMQVCGFSTEFSYHDIYAHLKTPEKYSSEGDTPRDHSSF